MTGAILGCGGGSDADVGTVDIAAANVEELERVKEASAVPEEDALPEAGALPAAAGALSGAGALPGLRALASAVERDAVDPDLILVYTASSQGFLEPCGCAARGKEMGGAARRATVVDSLRTVGAPVFLVEAGDFVGGGGEAGEEIGSVSLKVMKAMGYDVIALGEGELALGEAFLEQAAAAGPAVAHANYSHPALGPAQKEGLLIEKNGLEIGVIGLLDPATLPPDLALENLVVEPPGPAAAAAAASLRSAGADLIVVLGHADFRQSGRMAGESGAPDLWVVGHGGKELSRPARIGDVLLLGAGNAGKLLGVLGLDLAEGSGAQLANRLYPLHLSVLEKPSIAALVSSLNPATRHRRVTSEQSRS